MKFLALLTILYCFPLDCWDAVSRTDLRLSDHKLINAEKRIGIIACVLCLSTVFKISEAKKVIGGATGGWTRWPLKDFFQLKLFYYSLRQLSFPAWIMFLLWHLFRFESGVGWMCVYLNIAVQYLMQHLLPSNSCWWKLHLRDLSLRRWRIIPRTVSATNTEGIVSQYDDSFLPSLEHFVHFQLETYHLGGSEYF